MGQIYKLKSLSVNLGNRVIKKSEHKTIDGDKFPATQIVAAEKAGFIEKVGGQKSNKKSGKKSGEDKSGEDKTEKSGEDKSGEDKTEKSGEDKSGEDKTEKSGEDKSGEDKTEKSGEDKSGEKSESDNKTSKK